MSNDDDVRKAWAAKQAMQGSMNLKADPWKHRSDGMACKSCMWFAPKVPRPVPVGCETGPTHLGRCRRHAPTMNGYPVVFVNDWCGDHKLDENSVAAQNM